MSEGLFDPRAFIRSAEPERAPTVDQGAPPAWRRGMALLTEMRGPDGIAPERWAQIVNDASLFVMSRCAWQAVEAGWTISDVFALDYEDAAVVGLVPGLRGDRVVDVTPEYASIKTNRGHRWHYRRHTPADSPPVWTYRGRRSW